MLSIRELENIPAARAIVSNAQFGVTALLTSAPSFSGGSDYGESIMSNLGSAISTEVNVISEVLKVLGANVTGRGGKARAQMAIKHNLQTTKLWQGAKPFGFTLNCVFIATEAGHDTMYPIRRLLSGVLPIRIDKGTLQAPLGYGIAGSGEELANAKSAKGTWSVSIGDWFKARQLVMQSIEYTPSREVTTDNTPLYIEVSMSFETFRVFDFEEVNAFFPRLLSENTSSDKWTQGVKIDTDDYDYPSTDAIGIDMSKFNK